MKINLTNITPYKYCNNFAVKNNYGNNALHKNTADNPFEHQIKPYELSSKFNINFRGIEDYKLDVFSQEIENKIVESITPKSEEFKTNYLSPEQIEIISKVFKEDKIGTICNTGISANAMIKYLIKKEQIETRGSNIGFILDEFSLDFIKSINLESFINRCKRINVKFYIMEPDKKKAENMLYEFDCLTEGNFPVRKIKNPKNAPYANYPKAQKIKKIMKTFARYKFPRNKKMQNKLIDVMCRYINENMLVFSYATLSEKLKEQYSAIENYLLSVGSSMDDVVYIIPEKDKSYNIINYLYAKANNIPRDKFKYAIESFPANMDNKICVILDDICGNGGSIENQYMKLLRYTKNIIFAPIVGCEKARELVIEPMVNMINNPNFAFLPAIRYNDLGYIGFYTEYESKAQLLTKYINNYKERFKNIDKDDIEFILANNKGGIGNLHTFIEFPYMIPDNSSELNALFGGYFLNMDTINSNKPSGYRNLYDCMPYEDYLRLKDQIKR